LERTLGYHNISMKEYNGKAYKHQQYRGGSLGLNILQQRQAQATHLCWLVTLPQILFKYSVIFKRHKLFYFKN